ncbi:MAG: arsenate reductase family protein [Flavobacteriales bacterium]
MKKVFHLGNCSTCQRIISDLEPEKKGFEFREIKSEAITQVEIEKMYALAGSYEALFSKRAMKYRSMGLNEMDLSEADFKKYILEEYTFLKRPVILTDDQIFIGSAKKIVEAAKTYLIGL